MSEFKHVEREKSGAWPPDSSRHSLAIDPHVCFFRSRVAPREVYVRDKQDASWRFTTFSGGAYRGRHAQPRNDTRPTYVLPQRAPTRSRRWIRQFPPPRFLCQSRARMTFSTPPLPSRSPLHRHCHAGGFAQPAPRLPRRQDCPEKQTNPPRHRRRRCRWRSA